MVVGRFSPSRGMRHASAALLAGSVFWWFAGQSGPREGEVTIRIISPDAEVRIDGLPYLAPTEPGEPIVARLPEGHHRLTVHRGGRLVYGESFLIRPGDQQMLAAFDQPHPGP